MFESGVLFSEPAKKNNRKSPKNVITIAITIAAAIKITIVEIIAVTIVGITAEITEAIAVTTVATKTGIKAISLMPTKVDNKIKLVNKTSRLTIDQTIRLVEITRMMAQKSQTTIATETATEIEIATVTEIAISLKVATLIVAIKAITVTIVTTQVLAINRHLKAIRQANSCLLYTSPSPRD